MTTDKQGMPPLPEPVMFALFMGTAMQGSEIRLLSSNYEPGCAQYTEDQVHEYGDARAAHARKQALEEAVKIARETWTPTVTIFTDGFNHAATSIESAIKELE